MSKSVVLSATKNATSVHGDVQVVLGDVPVGCMRPTIASVCLATQTTHVYSHYIYVKNFTATYA